MNNQKTGFSRRKFLAASAAGLASASLATLAPGIGRAQETGSASAAEGKPITRRLGKTDIETSVISMGAGACNDPSVIQAAFELGIRHFDTAGNYQYGANEQMVGRAIQKMGVRDQAIIATKIYTPQQRRDYTEAQAKKKLVQLVDGSLKRLKTEYLDILYLHDVAGGESTNDPVTMAAMAQIKQSGKTRYVGVSTHTNMADVLNAVADGGFWDVVLTAVNFTMADDTSLVAALARAAKSGVGIVGMKVMAGGSNWPNPETRRTYSADVIARACLKWVLRTEHVHTVIPGFNSFDHMQQNYAVGSNLDLSDQEGRFLSDNAIKLGMEFCRQCRKCLASCPGGAEIPTLMRTHMYLAQYGVLHMARAAMDEIPAGRGITACADCTTCTARCANSVNIGRRIDELRLLYA
ncbi:MAG: aldo/keto reductase [bacterium]